MHRHAVIGVPIYQAAHPAFVASLLSLLPMLERQGWRVTPIMRTGSLVTKSRSAIVSEFLASKADVLVWIDADEAVRPGDVASLLEGAARWGFFGGVYAEKRLHIGDLPWEEIAEAAKANVAPSNLQYVGQKLAFDFRPEDVDAERGYIGPTMKHYGRTVVRVAHMGTGFFAMSREAVQTVVDANPELAADGGMVCLFNSTIANRKLDGEDWYFCNLATKAGCSIWLDTECTVDHYGLTSWRGSLRGTQLDTYAKRQAQGQIQ